MFEEMKIKYLHPGLNLGMQDIRNVWVLTTVPEKLSTGIHQGNLIFRFPLSGKRISYKTLRKGLLKKQIVIRKTHQLLPF
jgi:hypothetical protein